MSSMTDYALMNYLGGTGFGSPSPIAEFLSDLSQFSNVKRWLNKYSAGKEYNIKIMVNQMVVLFNQFTFESVEFILRSNIDPRLVNTLFAFFLSRETYGEEGIDDVLMCDLKVILKEY